MDFQKLLPRVQGMLARLDAVEQLLGSPDVFQDQAAYRKLTQEHAYLSRVKHIVSELEKGFLQLTNNETLLKEESDPELLQMVREDNRVLESSMKGLTQDLELLLVPPDPLDNRNVILELRAGTGGDEAALFVGDCVRMYKGYADRKGWKSETVSSAPSDRGGFKEYILAISGEGVFRCLQHEAGTHRVQRVPETETQGRVHTSAITVAVLPEPTEQEQLEIDPSDLRIDTFRASGAGGQHTNKTDSAVRITHLPTGIVVACQKERSQHTNRAEAMRILSAKIMEAERKKQAEEIASLRSSHVGSGDRSEKIRTWNFPQNRVTDHRVPITLYQLSDILDGDLEEMTRALITYFYEQKLHAAASHP